MKKLISTIVTLAAINSADACLKYNNDGDISDMSIAAFNKLMERIGSPTKRNKMIENCYSKYKKNIDIVQVQELVSILGEDGSNHYYDNDETLDRIYTSYFNIHKKTLSFNKLVEFADLLNNPLTKNQSIEDFYDAHYRDLSVDDLQEMFTELGEDGSNHYYDNDETLGRIITHYLNENLARLSQQELVELLKYFTNSLTVNKWIEQFAETNEETLSFKEIIKLSEHLREHGSNNYYDNDETKYRFVKKYIDTNFNSFSPKELIHILKHDISTIERNELIEKYYKLKRKSLSQKQLFFLIKKLGEDSSNHYYDNDETASRILSDHIEKNKKSMSAKELTKVIKYEDNLHQRNVFIHQYFEANKKKINMDDLHHLINNLEELGNHNYYDNDESEARMMDYWINNNM